MQALAFVFVILINVNSAINSDNNSIGSMNNGYSLENPYTFTIN
jgi:hypothetical protein